MWRRSLFEETVCNDHRVILLFIDDKKLWSFSLNFCDIRFSWRRIHSWWAGINNFSIECRNRELNWKIIEHSNSASAKLQPRTMKTLYPKNVYQSPKTDPGSNRTVKRQFSNPSSSPKHSVLIYSRYSRRSLLFSSFFRSSSVSTDVRAFGSSKVRSLIIRNFVSLCPGIVPLEIAICTRWIFIHPAGSERCYCPGRVINARLNGSPSSSKFRAPARLIRAAAKLSSSLRVVGFVYRRACERDLA